MTLTLASAATSTDAVSVGYTVPPDAAAARLKDLSDNPAESFTGQTVTNNTAAAQTPLTASVESAPPSHNGSDEFRIRIAFSEEPKTGFSYKIMRDHGSGLLLHPKKPSAIPYTVSRLHGRFNRRRLYTAWDNLGQEKIFFEGVDRLEAAGIPPRHLMVYMLVGYAPGETMEQVLHRHRRLEERGCEARTWPRNNEETRHARRSAPTALAATRPVRADPESSRFKRR